VITSTGYVAYWVLERAAIIETGSGLTRREALVAREVAARALPAG
jgi:FRG domain